MPTTLTRTHAGNGARLVSLEGKDLPLRSVVIDAEAEAGLARVTLRQTFHNQDTEPLEAVYSLPLPADGSVFGYTVTLGDRVIRGTLEKRDDARERYQQALVEGHTAGWMEQQRGNLFTQNVGNIPPGADVVIEVNVDHRLAWISGGIWEWRFPTVVAPRYLGPEDRVPDAQNVTVDVADAPTGIGAEVRLSIGDTLAGPSEPESPSHAVRIEGRTVILGDGTVPLDRDVVVRWRVNAPVPGVTLRRGFCAGNGGGGNGDDACGLITIVPPAVPARAHARDLILLIDTSGSMDGAPLEHAKRCVSAVIESLTPDDSIEIIAFSSRPYRWKSRPVPATPKARREALAWIRDLRAGGGTEMLAGLEESLAPLRGDARRQVLLVTDGLIGLESGIVAMLRDRLPHGSRLHAVGVGAAVNHSLIGPAARAGRGCAVVVDLEDGVEEAAARIVAATEAPVLTDLRVEGDAVADRAPERLPDVMAGAPVLVGVRLKASGGILILRGETPEGPWTQSIEVPGAPATERDAAVARFYARGKVEDLEMHLASSASSPGERRRIEAAIERCGLRYGIATRLTSWVAVSEEKTVDPHDPSRVTRIPQNLPYGLSAEGLGLRGMVSSRRERQCMLTLRSDSAGATGEFMIDGSFRSKEARNLMRRADWIPEIRPSLSGRKILIPTEEVAIIEVTMESGRFEWEPGELVTIVLGDGTHREVEVVAQESTRAGVIRSGMRFRLALKCAPELIESAAEILIMSGGESFPIPLA